MGTKMRLLSSNIVLILFGQGFSVPPLRDQSPTLFGLKSELSSNLTFYSIDENFTKQKVTNVPFQTKAPYMVYNSEYSVIEVFGDWRTGPRKLHEPTLHHYFYDYETDIWTDNTAESNYDGENQGAAVYTNELGTILLNGWSWTYHEFTSVCYQVTKPKNDQDFTEIPNLPIAMDNFGAKYHDSKIYVAGGYYQTTTENFIQEVYPTTLYYLDLTGAYSNLPGWKTLPSLTKPGMPLEIEIFDGVLYAFNGISDQELYNVGVETYDLISGETEYIDNVLNFGRYHGAFVLTGGSGNPVLNLFGGEVYPDCKADQGNCNTAEFGAVGFKNVSKFSVNNNPEFFQYEGCYLGSV